MSNLITQTKIIVPRRRSDLLSRQRLTELLYDNLIDQKITIIAAPAGYGKTSLAVDLAHQVDLPICWYALDMLDQDLQRFISHFIASIAYRFPQFGKQSRAALLNIGQFGFDINRFVTIIVNEIYEQVREHFALVLDDFHLVDTNIEIGDFINRFAQVVGENCHLLILSRKLLTLTDLPLMIARSQVSGLDYNELAFRSEEIQALVLQKYHLTIPKTEAKSLAKETEGWITGLLLSTQTMWQGLSDRVRTARVSDIGLYDYLSQQVLDQQPASVREFLLHTSLLEEFDADLCEEVFGTQRDWNTLIKILLRDNLFILPVGDGGNWVRYHHLFRDFLQVQLAREQSDTSTRILRRLATVFTRRENWERAYEIYQRLGDMKATADLIEKARESFMQSGRWISLAKWLDSLPTDILTSRPGLLSTRGIVAVMLGEIEHGLTLLNQAEVTLQTSGNTHELAYTLERRAYAFLFSGDYEAALLDAEQALSLAGQKNELRIVRAEAFKVKAHCWKHLGQIDANLKALKMVKAIFTELGYQDDLALVSADLGATYRLIGSYEQAKSAYQVAIDHFHSTNNIVNLALLQNNAGVTYHATGDYLQASRYFDDALIHARQSGYKYTEAYTLSSIGDLFSDMDASDAALKAYKDARQVAEHIQNRFLLIYLNLAEGALACSKGELHQASDLIQSARSIAEEGNYPYEQALCQLGAGRLALAEDDAHQAQKYMEEVANYFEDGSHRVESVRTRIYLALAYHSAGDMDGALKQLERAFQQASKLEIFLNRFGLNSREKFFAYTENHVEDILTRNERMNRDDFYTVRSGRPFLIATGAFLRFGSKDYLFEMTPWYTGVQEFYKKSLFQKRDIGGGYIESFAFDSDSPDFIDNQTADVRIGNKNHRFTLSDVLGTTGAAPSEVLDNAKLNFIGFPEFKYWPAKNVGKVKAKEYEIGDGGNIENLGILPLLKRGVERIIIFVNTKKPLSLKNKTQINGSIKALFKQGGVNHVFESQELKFLQDGLLEKLGAEKATTYTGIYTVLANEHHGVVGGNKVKILWVYNHNYVSWEKKLPAEVSKKIGKGRLSNFPHFATFGENIPKLINLHAVQANLLSHMSCAVVRDNIDEFLDIISN